MRQSVPLLVEEGYPELEGRHHENPACLWLIGKRDWLMLPHP